MTSQQTLQALRRTYDDTIADSLANRGGGLRDAIASAALAAARTLREIDPTGPLAVVAEATPMPVAVIDEAVVDDVLDDERLVDALIGFTGEELLDVAGLEELGAVVSDSYDGVAHSYYFRYAAFKVGDSVFACYFGSDYDDDGAEFAYDASDTEAEKQWNRSVLERHGGFWLDDFDGDLSFNIPTRLLDELRSEEEQRGEGPWTGHLAYRLLRDRNLDTDWEASAIARQLDADVDIVRQAIARLVVTPDHRPASEFDREVAWRLACPHLYR